MAFPFKFRKKAIMGVSTLIIFITAILTAAVAASVIVRTVGVLQERAFTVGTETRDRLITAVDVISVSANSNVTAERVYGLTMLIRTRAGSYAYDLGTAGLIVTTGTGSYTASLQHTENEELGFTVPSLQNTTDSEITDMDEDRLSEIVRLDTTTTGLARLEFFFSRESETAYADLGINISSAAPGTPVNVTVQDIPIVGDNGKWYGFVHVDGITEDDDAITSPDAEITVTNYPLRDFCSFERLIPEDAFCYDVQLGMGDTAISRGEIYRVYFRFRPQNAMRPDEDFEIKFIPEKGAITSVVSKVPDSIQREVAEIWPTTLET
ncbi:MAG: hypothetical protein ACOCUR_01820 [Nanoarchaeota archaeon]